MGRLPQRRRGKGSTTYRAVSHHYKAKSAFKTYDDNEKNNSSRGLIVDLIHDPARRAPLMIVQFEEQTMAVPAPLGVMVGSYVEAGVTASIDNGNFLPLKSIPEGTIISNIELTPGDGGKLERTAGSKARLVSKEGKIMILKLSSNKTKKLNENCRAMIGVIAGGGHGMKPIVKAGNQYYQKKSKGKRWPVPEGSKRNACDHPQGGKQHKKRKKHTVSRNAPPGAKVGSIAARRTGTGGKRK